MNGNIPVNIAVYNDDMGGCQNYGPFLGTLFFVCRIFIGTQKKRDHHFDSHPYRDTGNNCSLEPSDPHYPKP